MTISTIVMAVFALAVIEQVATRSLFAVMTLACTLTVFTVMQADSYTHGPLQDAVGRLAYVASALILAVI